MTATCPSEAGSRQIRSGLIARFSGPTAREDADSASATAMILAAGGLLPALGFGASEALRQLRSPYLGHIGQRVLAHPVAAAVAPLLPQPPIAQRETGSGPRAGAAGGRK
jgi:hypothetical protein